MKRIEGLRGQVLSEYRGNAVLLMRVRGSGAAIRSLLEMPDIAEINVPPTPDLQPLDVAGFNVENIGEVGVPADAAAAIGVVDSGVTTAHPLLDSAHIEAFGAPANLGDDDQKKHGTPVSGIAVYGDLREQIDNGRFEAVFPIASAKVVDQAGAFDDTKLVPAQMDEAIRRLHGEFNCRIINVSLADKGRLANAKRSPWAAVLDELARELDLVIVVTAGNSDRDLVDRLGDGSWVLTQTTSLIRPT